MPSALDGTGALTRVLSCSGVRMPRGRGLVLWSGGSLAAGLVRMWRRWWSQPRKRLTAQTLQQRVLGARACFKSQSCQPVMSSRVTPGRVRHAPEFIQCLTCQGWVTVRGFKGGSAPLARSYRGPDNEAGPLLGHLNPALAVVSRCLRCESSTESAWGSHTISITPRRSHVPAGPAACVTKRQWGSAERRSLGESCWSK
jgi:hypothetical protein